MRHVSGIFRSQYADHVLNSLTLLALKVCNTNYLKWMSDCENDFISCQKTKRQNPYPGAKVSYM